MSRTIPVILALAIALAGVLIMRTSVRDDDGEGWTGRSEPGEVIEARRLLMIRIEPLMRPIDAFTAGDPGDLATLRANADTIEAVLLAFPHLFPPTTNRYDPASRESQTIALPAIWEAFPTFLTLSETAAAAAASVATADDAEQLKTAGRSLRAACDGCHAQFARPYQPPTVTKEDLEFDFDSVFPPK
jgi:cytochrome c556